MRDVAALAGVSLKTVSRVVNDEPGVSPDVRERVTAAVNRLDYRPNMAASNLRRTGARTGLIGALVQDLSNSFSASLLRALEDSARRHGTAVLAASLDEGADREQELVHDLVTRRVDGLVIMPASERQDYLVSELRSGTPAVFVDPTAPIISIRPALFTSLLTTFEARAMSLRICDSSPLAYWN